MKSLKRKIIFLLPSITALLLASLFFFSTAFTQEIYFVSNQKLDTTMLQYYYVELKGTVRESKLNKVEEIKPVDSAKITIFANEVKLSEVFTTKKGKCAFKLPLGKFFKIEVSKKGFATKFFDVKTKVPFDKVAIYNYSFDIDIFEDIKGLDLSVLKKPIAKVAYDLISEKFTYDVGYTSRINSELKKMYKNYYLLKKMDVDLMDEQQKTTEPEKQN